MENLIINYWHSQPFGISGIHRTANYFAKNGHDIKIFTHPEHTSNCLVSAKR